MTTSDLPLAELRQVVKQFPGPGGHLTPPVLNQVSLILNPGDAMAIMGPSGSGKSTLLHLLGGLDRPTTGSVWFEGRDLAELNDHDLAALRNRRIGFIFQLHHLLPQCTALENVLIPTLPRAARGSSDNSRERARRFLERVGLAERQNYRPAQLSGGECQRVAVVRALINQPRLLLADEPTGALDRPNAEGLADLLSDLNREEGIALLVVTHAPDLAARMRRQFRLRDGQLEPVLASP